MNNDNKIIDVDSIQVDDGEQTAWKSCFDNMGEQYPLKKKRKRGRIFKGFGIVSGIVLAALLGGISGSAITYSLIVKNNSNKLISQTQYIPQSFKESGETLTATEAFNKVSPAVVIVSTKGFQNINYYGFYSQQQQVEGIGSGFIINEEGYILTNYHVIESVVKSENELSVTLSNNKEVPAKVVNYDESRDVAMLKLSEDVEIPGVAELGDSDSVYPGEEVIAIGTPLSKDFAQTLTKGVISGNNRSVSTSSGESLNLIQTDTAINPGNSGGPLVNSKGQVIGINSMKIGSNIGESIEGIGFAIPINEVKNKLDTLSKPTLNFGIKVREIDKDTAKQHNLEQGIYVISVDEFSPAEKAGMKVGDIIVKCDGKECITYKKLKEIKQSKNAGDTIKITVVRNEKNVELELTLEE